MYGALAIQYRKQMEIAKANTETAKQISVTVCVISKI